ncbi:hypothetical protein [Nostoc flagelliforme]|uniref:hypothetical protein n=1 Tax=Nostoc flagelliforme TaxID=1306274 RepID=UPI001F54F3B0|nr:hypothetical protein [Nostoc flagelliforme]
MLFTLAERKDERPLVLIYASKNWDNIIYREEIKALKEKLDLTVIHVLKNWRILLSSKRVNCQS